MLNGPPAYVECPSCKYCQWMESMISGNLLGVTRYTDGHFFAPMLLEKHLFLRCPNCGAFFKLDNSISISSRNEPDRAKQPNVPKAQFFSVDDHCQAIEHGLFNSDSKGSAEWEKDVLSLRLSLWRTMNHHRERPDLLPFLLLWSFNVGMANASDDEKAIYRENCIALLSSLKPDSDTNRLLLAELRRNLGEFDMCTAMLGEIEDAEEYDDWISSIRRACADGNTFTVPIKTASS